MPSNQEFYQIDDSFQLPLFDGQEAIHLATNMQGLNRLQGHERFVRYIRIADNLCYPLRTILEIADEVFEGAAQAMGAQVVPHTWGLAPHFNHRASQYHIHPSLPRHKLLAAEVTFIPDLEPLDETDRMISDDVIDLPIITQHGPHRWFDGSKNNFGRSPQGLHLVDLDIFMTPVYKVNNLRTNNIAVIKNRNNSNDAA
jgi:hypothetical protein